MPCCGAIGHASVTIGNVVSPASGSYVTFPILVTRIRQLYRQFADTISASMLISALNALTLSLALGAVVLRHGGPKRGVMGWIRGRIDGLGDGYAWIAGRALRLSVLSLVVLARCGAYAGA